HNNSEEAIAIIQAEQREIDLYRRFKAYCSYGVYIATKI
ncbi:MAG TPA: SAM-dependent methyltransferase, partial [Opitutae bacterium]|nr:SAM-dependent methyltransferase [Opitutae bacterium]